jgi:capsular exopolysaccharide synthesis family protein
MSRIDEALKRSSQGPLAARNINLAIDSTLKRTDERTLDEYPVETKPLGEGTDRPERSERVLHRDAKEPPAPAMPDYKAPTEQRRWPPRQVAAGNDKLMVGEHHHPMSLEQYRRLAATLHDAQVDKGLKAVVITSAVPKEGKTLTAVNLALTFSESYGRRVLLIDADLRRPSVHEVLGIPNTRGLSDVLAADRIELPTVDVSPLLAVLPSGHPDQSPLAGLSSERMRMLLEEVASRYDWVILDTPPLGLLSDATLLTRLTQAAVFVIRAGSTPHDVIDRAISDLGREYVIGTVLNGVEEDAIPVKGYYGDYYGERR